MNYKDYYKILGISPNASQEDIDKAYKRLVMKYHPDRCSDKDASDKMVAINEAYKVLKNKSSRASYDQYKNSSYKGSVSFDEFNEHMKQGGSRDRSGDGFFENFQFQDIFDTFFGRGGFNGAFYNSGHGGHSGSTYNFYSWSSDQDHQSGSADSAYSAKRNVLVKTDISFEEWYNGVSKHLKYSRQVACVKCKKDKVLCTKCNGTGATYSFMGHKRACVCNKGYTFKHIFCRQCDSGCITQTESINLQIPAFCRGKIKVSGAGSYDIYLDKYGDLILSISILKHEVYSIDDNNNVIMSLKIGIDEFIYGCTVSFKYLDGTYIELKIPAMNTKPIIATGRGINTSGFGATDLIINVEIVNNMRQDITIHQFRSNNGVRQINSSYVFRN